MHATIGKTILLVEDEALTAMLQTRLLQGEGYLVQAVSSGEAALDFIKNQTAACDLVLMDYDLGSGLDGLQTAKAILELAAASIPIVFLSNHAKAEILAKISQISNYGYLLKDSPPSVLFTGIRTALSLHESKLAIARLAQQDRELRESLALQKSLLDSILESSTMAIFALDRHYCYLSFNQAHASTMKKMYHADIELGHSLYEYQTVPEDSAKSKANLDRCLAGEQFVDSAFSGNSNGLRIYIEVWHNPIRDASGQIIGASIFAHDISARKEAEERVAALLQEKDLLLKETHHRVKNNLNMVYSLLNIRAETAGSTYDRESLREAAGSVQAMLLLYNKLYCGPTQVVVSFAEYIKNLTMEIIHSYASLVSVHPDFSVPDIPVSPAVLPTLGIIVNELLTNSIKYAFRGRRRGAVSISAFVDNAMIEFEYRDDGPGLSVDGLSARQPAAQSACPDQVLTQEPGHFGLQLVSLLVEQLRGTVQVHNEGGACFRIRFPAGQA